MEENQKTYYVWNILFFVGLLLGTFVTNLIFKNQTPFNDLWNMDQYQHITTGDLTEKQYFVFLILRRGKQLGMIFILFLLTNRALGVGIPLFLFSFSTSALLSLETMRMGLLGVGIGIVYLLPHYLCYGFSLCVFSKMGQRISQSRTILLQVGVIIGVWIIGCYLEAYWNPTLVKILTTIVTQ
ncbi:MAG: hypothetical protein IAC13_02945 [Firmicutes bacterium]|uniref:Stage II sporulation protein M n=1 Tax=Candidatus Scybalomonas excrementavium TaxID=2840943 RepID=A0A9D9N777_9FIRM|nr:hypothetical protein [Candidatus Scybalomonas excrementavium]